MPIRWKRRALFAALYLSEGAPIGFFWWLLPTRLRAAGVPIDTVTGFTASLALVWSIKVFWAPVLDVLRGPRWGYRSWMLSAQAVMGLALVPVALLDPVGSTGLLLACGLVHAVAAATQDVAIDAIAIATTEPAERGPINGWMQVGMLTGRSVFGGLALRYADDWGLPAVVAALVAVIWTVGLVTARSPLLASPALSGARLRAVLPRLARALGARRILLGLAFALVSAAAFEGLGGVAGPYLIDHGWTEEAVGDYLAFVSVPAMAAGALLGGLATRRLGARRAVAGFLVAIAGTAAAVALGGDRLHPAATLTPFYLAIGLFTAASYALFMNLTDSRFAATQFTAFMAATNLCESGSQRAMGEMVARAGGDYRPAILVLAVASLAALPVLRFLPLAPAPPGGRTP